MKKVIMKDGEPNKFIILNSDNYFNYPTFKKHLNLLKKNGYHIYDAKDDRDITLYYDCNAYFDRDGYNELKDGRRFKLDFDLKIIDESNAPISREITKCSCDGKDGIHFTLPGSFMISLEEIIYTAIEALPKLYPEEKPVGVVETEYLYAIYLCRIDANGNKTMTLPYYSKDIKAAQELISLENKFHELFSNGHEKTEWYEVSEIDIESNKHVAEFVKSTTKEITLEDVKNIKPTVTAYTTTTRLNECNRKWYSSMFNKTLYIALYPNQPKIEGTKLDNNVEHIDNTGFLHISHSFIVDLEDAENSKKTIYSSMIHKAIILLKRQYHKHNYYYSLQKILDQFDNF